MVLSVMEAGHVPSFPAAFGPLVVPAVPIFQRRGLRLQTLSALASGCLASEQQDLPLPLSGHEHPAQSLHSAPDSSPAGVSPRFLCPIHLMWDDRKGGRFHGPCGMLISLMSAGCLHTKAQETLGKWS